MWRPSSAHGRAGSRERGNEELNVLLGLDDEPPDADEQDQTSFDSDSSLASEEGPYHLSESRLERMTLKDHTAYLIITMSAHSQVLVSSFRA